MMSLAKAMDLQKNANFLLNQDLRFKKNFVSSFFTCHNHFGFDFFAFGMGVKG